MSRPVSTYARKHSYLARKGLWGFDVGEPKPWKKATEGGSQGNNRCRYAAEIAAKIEEISRRQGRGSRHV